MSDDFKKQKQQFVNKKMSETQQAAKQSATSFGGDFASRLGVPVNTSGGIHMGVPNLPDVGESIPTPKSAGNKGFIPPGAVPGMTPEMMAKISEAAAKGNDLEDDHAELFGEPPPTQNAHVRQSVRTTNRNSNRTIHPILLQLKQDLGTEEIPTVDAYIGKHKFTMKVANPSDIAFAARIADASSVTSSEYSIKFDHALMSAIILALDDYPVWEVFSVNVPAGMTIIDPMNPPDQVRFLGALKLNEFLMDQSKAQLGLKLHKFYTENLDNHSSVDLISDISNPKFLYTCPEKNCDHQLKDISDKDASGNDRTYYCKFHGVPMQMSGKILPDGSLGPLD